MVMMIINIIFNYLKDAFTNSDLVEAHTMQYLILYHVLFHSGGILEMDKQIRCGD